MAGTSQDPRFRDSFPSLDNNAWSLSAIAIILVGLRIWCRCNGTRRLWWDDYLLVISLVLIIAAAAIFTAVLNQTYKPTDRLLPSGPGTTLYLSVFHVLSTLSQAFSKTSIVATFLRLTSGIWKVSLWISIIVFDGILIAYIFAAWMPDCDVTFYQPYRFQGKSLSFFFDIFLAALPWKIVRNLRLKRYEKIGLAISMSLGVVAGSAALARLVLWLRVDSQPIDQQLRYQLDLVLWNFMVEGWVYKPNITLTKTHLFKASRRRKFRDRHGTAPGTSTRNARTERIAVTKVYARLSSGN
ncbi:hypothetical protein F4820DRAFT_471380 [Hypoxylon rubiginosum]|uniref:Uncharacterized protein n=1 Tax=Hypoxylon rubiginosum TaxID=110542 RepID=A0ACB9YW53_9PEZI|nr:hypothetical protein F4820DRAFT_471380 [Hypoxylon rubiginosum]